MEPSPFTAEFGRRVARRRRIVGLKQWQIAEHVGVHRSHITQLEKGTYKSIQLEQFAKLADVLQTSADYLLQRIEHDPGPVPDRRSPGAVLCCGGDTLPPVTTDLERTVANAEHTNFPYL
ncbi:MAG TPA: helix-turn-helix domain-containing protein [Candidatus Saccharimonadia bacterium]|nr:helix-turn-helix domain-containing protein [Candidatus Saccharimonadia bacterium]